MALHHALCVLEVIILWFSVGILAFLGILKLLKLPFFKRRFGFLMELTILIALLSWLIISIISFQLEIKLELPYYFNAIMIPLLSIDLFLFSCVFILSLTKNCKNDSNEESDEK